MIEFLKELFGVNTAKHEPRKINPVPSLKRDMVDAVRGRGYQTVTLEELDKEMEAECAKFKKRKDS